MKKKLTERQRFERWMKKACPNKDLYRSSSALETRYGYFDPHTQTAWEAWLASKRVKR